MIDINILSDIYFCFDDPVPFKINGGDIKITPVELKNSSLFLTSVPVLLIDKNSFPDPSVIQMSYLNFICELVKENSVRKQQFLNILILCLGLKYPEIKWFDEKHKKPVIYDKILNFEITSKQFDEIKKIILYQNIVGYDDEYINPELKEVMAKTDAIKNKNIKQPSLERKIALITACTGLSKKEQMNMTLRSHEMLFKEIVGTVNYKTFGAIAALNGNPLDDLFYQRNKDKFEDYITDVEKYQNSMGGNKSIKIVDDTNIGDSYIEQIKNFNK